MRVLLADPPAFTPWYDHELAAGLARAGADVELLTSHFRFGDVPPPDGYRVQRAVLSALLAALQALARAAAAEGGGARRRHARRSPQRTPTWCTCSGSRCRRPTCTCGFASPAVFTAHDLLPRRTAGKRDLWRRLLERFDRVVVHSERGRETLAELGIDARVIPHPVYPSAATRADDGRTLLSLGVIRPYKGLPDAIEATRRIPECAARRRGRSGDAARRPLGAERAEWQLGYLPQSELDRHLSEATWRCSRIAPSSTSRARSCRHSAPACPSVVYDVAGLGEPIRAFGAGAVVPAGDVDAFTAAVLAARRRRRARARRGREQTRRARELTWDAAAAPHLDLYRELA